jgi:hypothetical protein
VPRDLLLAHRSGSFANFLDVYIARKEAAGDPTIPYLFPSTRWDKVASGVPSNELGGVEFGVMLLTLFRNDFIGKNEDHLLKVSLVDSKVMLGPSLLVSQIMLHSTPRAYPISCNGDTSAFPPATSTSTTTSLI